MNTHIESEAGKPRGPLLPLVRRLLEEASATGDPQAVCLECAALLEEIAGLGIDAQGMEFLRKDQARIGEPDATDSVDFINAALKEAMLELTADERMPFEPYQRLAQRAVEHCAAQARNKQRANRNEKKNDANGESQGQKQTIGEYQPDLPNIARLSGEQFERGLLYPGNHLLHKTDEYIPKVKEAKAIEDALLRNPYREKPWEPGTLWLGDIYDVVYRELHLADVAEDEARQALIPVPCLGEAMDLRYGVDFLFLYTDPRTKQSAMVTADITKDVENKLERGFKADVLVTPRGIYVNPDLPVPSLQELYNEKQQGIIKLERADRRRSVGKVLAEILQYKLDHKFPMKLRDPVDLLRKEGNVIPFARQVLRHKLHRNFVKHHTRRNVQ